MANDACEWLLPRYCVFLTPDNEILRCLLKTNHEGQHLIKLTNGQFVVWEPYPCGEDCGELCECFAYGKVSDAFAKELLSQTRSNS